MMKKKQVGGITMANFAVAASAETIERAQKVLEIYGQPGGKKEDALNRIIDLAQKEAVKGTHPALEPSLNAIDGTISTLIKQINGIVAGQDAQIADLTDRVNEAITEGNNAVDRADRAIQAAEQRAAESVEAIQRAEEQMAQVRAEAESTIQTAKKEAAQAVKEANAERDAAVKERDAAQTIATEKTANNELLLAQMQGMRADIEAYKQLQAEYEALRAQLTETQQAVKTQELQAELDKERALMELERRLRDEFSGKLREADREVALLKVKLEEIEKK